MRRRFSLFPCAVATASCLLLLAATPSRAQMPPDGTWRVNGRAVPGTRCADWFVTIRNGQGHLSGVVGVGQGNVPIHGLSLQPDGSFSGVTRAGHINGRVVRAYEVNGRFNGAMVSLTLENEICPTRSGTAVRSGY